MKIPEVINTSIEKEHLLDVSLSDNENTAEKGADTTPMSQINNRKMSDSKKLITPEIKKKSKNVKKLEKVYCKSKEEYLGMKYFQIGRSNCFSF